MRGAVFTFGVPPWESGQRLGGSPPEIGWIKEIITPLYQNSMYEVIVSPWLKRWYLNRKNCGTAGVGVGKTSQNISPVV